MSNERIDLTQFEGMVEYLGEPCLNQALMPLGNEWLIPNIAHLECGLGMESDDLEQIRITVLAMSKAPELIAELKRCYDREDSLLESLNGLLDAVFWDPYEDEDTTLEIDREVAEQIRDSVNEASE